MEGMGIKIIIITGGNENVFIYTIKGMGYRNNENTIMGMGGNGIEKIITANLYFRA